MAVLRNCLPARLRRLDGRGATVKQYQKAVQADR